MTLPGNLVSVGANAFGGCASLTTVDIESAVENPDFAKNAFISTSGEAYVTTVNIGAGMGLVNMVAVFGDKVVAVTVADGNKYYSVDEQGILYDVNKTEISYCPYDVKDIVLPDSLEKIGTAVFMRRTLLESVVIGAKVSEIGESAFYGCTSLKTVTINGTKAKDGTVDGESSELTILADAFSGCTAMESIEMPERLTYIESGAFAGVTGDIYIVNTTEYMKKTFPDWESTTGFAGTAYYYLDIDPEDVEFNEEGTAYRYNYWCIDGGAVVKIDYSPMVYAATDCYVLYNEVLNSVVGIYCFDEESEEYVCLGVVSCTSDGDGYTVVVSVGEEESSYSVVLDGDTMTATVTALS